MRIKPLNMRAIARSYGDGMLAKQQPVNGLRFNKLMDMIYDFNRIISDVNEEGTIDGEIMWDKKSRDWQTVSKLKL